MSYAERALVLVRLDARAGESVAVSDLAQHLMLPEDVVRSAIGELELLGLAVAVRTQAVPASPIMAACACGTPKQRVNACA